MRRLIENTPLPDMQSQLANPEKLPYRGRFAPSPTGPLHFGSLVAAVGSYLEAISRNGSWQVRMEDLDRPRCQQSSADDILRTLAAYGFEWDGEVLYQSRRDEAYQVALDQLRGLGRIYPCACTRRELADSHLTQEAIDGAQVYPGTCRLGLPPGKLARAWRLSIEDEIIAIDDAVQGKVTQVLARDVGDFVLLRADGLFSYQLAVVVDDAAQGITHVVRGADLLDSTPRQILLQQLLILPRPSYAHLPVAIDANGEKLSKQTRALPLSIARPQETLHQVLQFLGQEPPLELSRASLEDIWAWGRVHWTLARVPPQRTLPVNLEANTQESNSDDS